MIHRIRSSAIRALMFQRRLAARASIRRNARNPAPPPATPTWPLPRRADGPTDEQVRSAFGKFDLWHYAYQFEGGLDFSSRHNRPHESTDEPSRPLRRYEHFMPWLLEKTGGSLRGKRVLDIACNSGFWSIQCALLGAEEVIGFDARDELIEQATLIKDLVGVDNVSFRTLDFWEMKPEVLGGRFDVVLNLGILYHLPKPVQALELTKAMAKEWIVLDTATFPSRRDLIRVIWEENFDIRNAVMDGMIATPSKSAVELMLKHLRFSSWECIPLRDEHMPDIYLEGGRVSWLIKA